MSSILEALKKLEDEKNARLSGTGNIAGKVVKSGRRSGQRPGWLLPAGMTCAAAIAAAATYMLTGVYSTGRLPVQPSEPAQLSRPQAVAVPAPVQPAQTMTVPPAAPVPAPDLPPAAIRNRTVTTPSSQVVRKKAMVNVAPQRQIEEPVKEEKHVNPTPPAALPDLPQFKVTGIGWQKDSAERLAVVNGRAVYEGAVIEGARVQEIFPDRVRFSFADRTFDVTLGKIPGENP